MPDNVFFSESLESLYLSNNTLSGEIPHFNGANDANKVLSIGEYLISKMHENSLTKRNIKSCLFTQCNQFVKTNDTEYLDLHSNVLSGKIPNTVNIT